MTTIEETFSKALEFTAQITLQAFPNLTKHLDPLYEKSPLALSLNVQEFHPVLNFKKNNLHEYVKRRGPKSGNSP